MARRSSARLRGRNSTTPKRVSLSHDAPIRTPRTLPAKLASLNEEEDDEMPGAFPRSVSPPNGTPTRPAKRINTGNATPRNITRIKPTDEEMHPQKHHHTVAKPDEEACYLGFQTMCAHTEPPKQKSGGIAKLQATPSRAHNNPPNPVNDVKSPSFQFTFRREHSLELSPDAKRLMLEKREEAVRIREQMVADGEGTQELGEVMRKMATPKGKKGRFSGVHQEAFGKMQSIAGHASAFRAKATAKVDTAEEKTKTLKRSPSKAQLDDGDSTLKKTLLRSPSKPILVQPGGGLPRPTSSHRLPTDNEPSSPAKRMKQSEVDDVSATRPSSSDDARASQPSTPQQHKTLRLHPSNPNLASLTAATQASLARAASVKANKTSMIPGPTLARSPSKPALIEKAVVDETNTPLLARSPSKANLFTSARKEVIDSTVPASPLLSRSPLKASISKKLVVDAVESSANDQAVEETAPLLARSPLKMSIAKNTDSSAAVPVQQNPVPLLARSPSKIALPSNPTTTQPSTPGKASGLLSRFNLLRASPMKSILRSPQRLYSNDPAKIASGTHLATPPPKNNTGLFSSSNDTTAQPTPVPATAPVGFKRVDFTSSTKARYEVKEASSTPSAGSTPQPATKGEVIGAHPKDMDIDYPTLPSPSAAPSPIMASPSPQKRRQTVAPGDFTFRAGGHSITFGPSPNAKAKVVGGRPSIRHVSAVPEVAATRSSMLPAIPSTAIPSAQGSKKRKFEFENENISSVDNKENTPENSLATAQAGDDNGDRPAKRTKIVTADTSSLSAPPKTRESSLSPKKRNPTLGVKPKGTKTVIGSKTANLAKERRETKSGSGSGKGGTISQARLAALAMPKKRV